MLNLRWRDNYQDRLRLSFKLGRELIQFDNNEPILESINTWTALFYKNDRYKLYERDIAQLHLSKDVLHGLNARIFGRYATRRSMSKNTDFSFFSKEELFENNAPFPFEEEDFFPENNAAILGIGFTYRPRLKYMTLGKRKINLGSNYPRFHVDYTKGLTTLDSDVDFDKIVFQVSDDFLKLNRFGYLKYRLKYGQFLNEAKLGFMDQFHFMGNEGNFAGTSRNLNRYRLNTNYEFSSTLPFFASHMEWHLDGFLWDRIPYLKRLAFNTIVGYNGLNRTDLNYSEFILGLDNIGFGIFRMFRVDYIWAIQDGGFKDHRIQFGITSSVGS